MNWTPNKPASPGLYRYRDEAVLNRNTVETYAEVMELSAKGLLVVRMTNGWHGSLIGFDGQWWGPIQLEDSMDCSQWDSRCMQLEGQRKQIQHDYVLLEEKYRELIHAVCKIYPGKSRHEVALQYIRNAEMPAVAPDKQCGQKA